MFNPFRLYRNYKRNKQLETDTLNGIYFFEVRGRLFTKVDPMIAYIKLKEYGFDVFGEDVEGVVKAIPSRTRAFLTAVCKTFDLTEYDPKTNTGITVCEALRLYLGFFRFITALKKNVFFLRDYLPSLEDRLRGLSANMRGNSDSTDDSSKLDSTKTSSTEPEPPVSPVSTESPAPLTE